VLSSSRSRVPAILCAIVLAGAVLYSFKISSKMADFDVFWRAGERAAAGEPLYRAEDGHYQFKYLPAFAMLVSPLTLLTPSHARAVWFTLSLSSLIALIAMSLRLWPERRRVAWLLVAVTIVVLGKFYAHELLLGQANAMFGAIIVAALLAIARGREGLAGALVALGVVLKPYALLLIPWLVLRRRWPSIAACVAGLAVALGLPLLRYFAGDTVALHKQWWGTVRDTTAPNLTSADNVSWLAMYTKWSGGDAAWAFGLWMVTGVAVVALLAWMWKARTRVPSPEPLEGAVLLLLVPLVSPQGWDYVLLLATPCVVCLVSFAGRLVPAMRIATYMAMAVMGLTLYDLMGRDAYRAFMMASGVTLCTFVLLAAAAELRLRHVA